jgi:ribonuclease R
MTKKSKKGSPYQADPQAASEAEKYENPVPSREYILQCLEEHGKLLSREQLAEIFALEDDPDRVEGLRRRLRAMERDGQIIFTRRGFAPVSKLDLIRGRVIGHPDGFGFLQPDEPGDDLFLSARQMSRVMHGDRVVAHVVGYNRRGKAEGAIVEVLEHAHKQVVGRFFAEHGACFLVADNKRLSQDIIIPCDKTLSASNGQFVVAAITHYPDKKRQAIGEVVEILGDHMAPGMEIDVAIRSYGLPVEWPEALEQEIAGLSPEVSEEAKQGRLDLRQVPLVTIDGEDARDFDDAVYCEPKGKGWRLYVAIADVSHYVMPKSALDIEAEDRGNSVYFPERVIPMLPEILSNGLCSLNPEVDRLCMVCEMDIDQAGEIARFEFHEAVICSHARLTYNKVAAMLVDKDKELREQYASLVPHLENLHELYKVLRQQRTQRGAIDFDTPETRIVFGETRKIEEVVPVYRNDAHMLIEECMIAANVCSARFLLKNKIPGLFRVHDKPDTEKVSGLREFLGEFGLQLKGGELPDAKHYAELLVQVKGHIDYHLIQTVMLRSLKQAQYQPENYGHFGLALDAYAHFTSPIRRYPDLLVHRAIRHVLRTRSAKKFAYNKDEMLQMGEHCSMTDRRADEVTRDVISWLKCEFMRDKVGDEFSGVISSVTSFGLFIELNDIYVEGLVHVSELDNDYYHFEAKGHRLVGERTAHVYRLGDPVRIRVVRVDLDERKMDFVLLEHTSAKTGHQHVQKTTAADTGKKKTGKKRSSARKSTTAGQSRGKKKTPGKAAASDSSSRQSVKKKTSTAKKSRTSDAKKKAVTRKRGSGTRSSATQEKAVGNKKVTARKKATAKKTSTTKAKTQTGKSKKTAVKKSTAKAPAKKKSMVNRIASAIKKKVSRKKKK